MRAMLASRATGERDLEGGDVGLKYLDGKRWADLTMSTATTRCEGDATSGAD